MAQQQPLPQLFGILPTGLPPIVTPSAAPTPTSFIFTLPARAYSHIAVFILPGITLPPDSAAAVYIQLPAHGGEAPQFKFLGGIGTGKESAFFKISGFVSGSGGAGQNGEVDMDAPEGVPGQHAEVTLGISLESAQSVAAQMSQLHSSKPTSVDSANASSALVLSPRSNVPSRPLDQEAKVKLAQKIIKNAFNFLASFSGNLQNGVEVVPLKAFEEWWKKFEGRVRSDPSFLEREDVD